MIALAAWAEDRPSQKACRLAGPQKTKRVLAKGTEEPRGHSGLQHQGCWMQNTGKRNQVSPVPLLTFCLLLFCLSPFASSFTQRLADEKKQHMLREKNITFAENQLQKYNLLHQKCLKCFFTNMNKHTL